MKLSLSVLPLLAGLLAACSSSSATTTPTDTKKTDAGASTPATATGDAAFASSPLMGTWDIALVSNGEQTSSVMTITPASLSFANAGSTLTENIGGDFVVAGDDTSHFPTTHTIQKLDTGDFPYALGGTWTFNGTGDNGCAATVADGAMTVKCTDLGNPLDAVFTPSHAAETTTFTRSSTLTSRFGALGGQWHLAGPKYACDAKFEASTFTATCAPNSNPAASVAIAITFGDGMASGKIDGGELSAKKR